MEDTIMEVRNAQKIYKEGGEKYINEYRILRTIYRGPKSKVKLCCVQSELGNLQHRAIKLYSKRDLRRKRSFVYNNESRKVIMENDLKYLYEQIKVLQTITIAINNQSSNHNHGGQQSTDNDCTYCIKTYQVLEDQHDEDGVIGIVQEYADVGAVMSSHKDHYHPLFGTRGYSEPMVKWMAVCALRALRFLHGLGLCHRDVKPDNMLVFSSGIIKLGDFDTTEAFDPITKKVKSTKGTQHFMAPECVEATTGTYEGHDGRAADVYAVGMTCWALLFSWIPSVGNPFPCSGGVFGSLDDKNSSNSWGGPMIRCSNSGSSSSSSRASSAACMCTACSSVRPACGPCGSEYFGMANVMEVLGEAAWTFPREAKVSRECEDFVMTLLEKDWKKRITVEEALEHLWVVDANPSEFRRCIEHCWK